MKAIDLHNEISAVINEIGDYRKLDNPTITGYESRSSSSARWSARRN